MNFSLSAIREERIAASRSLSEVGAGTWDVIVVGAGPAGTVAARELARRGCRALLVDRASFPRGKICGCCLNGRALALLEQIGLGDLVPLAGGVPLREFVWAAGGRSARVPLPRGAVLSREALDAGLVRSAIAAGAKFLPETQVVLAERDDQAAMEKLTLRQGEHSVTVHVPVVLAADGLGGRLLARAGRSRSRVTTGSRLGFGVVTEPASDGFDSGVIYMTCGPAGYLGLVRLEDGRLDLAAALNAEAVRAAGGPGNVAQTLLATAGWDLPRDWAALRWRGTLPLTRQVGRLVDGRVFSLGDAAGYVEPFTGEGIAWALASGVAVAPLAAEAVRTVGPPTPREWARVHRRLVSRRQLVCRAASALLRRPRLAACVVHLLSCAAPVARPVLRLLNAAG